MGEESEALRADIERRRESMSKTIDAIADKVVPARVIEQRRAAVRGWANERSRSIAGVVAVGVAALVTVSLVMRRVRKTGE